MADGGASLDRYVTLGRSGLRVSPLCLGTMTFGAVGTIGEDAATSVRVLDAYVDRGGNFVDTANFYGFGASERIIGDHLATSPEKRHRLVLASKFSANLDPGDPNGGGANRKSILRACDDSLRRLRTDHIDLYWLHWNDPFTPVDETMRALDDLVRAGKVRYIGFSDTPAWRVAEAQVTASFRGWAPLIALQIEYSLVERTVEGELLPMAAAMGLGITPWSPLKGGLLSGRYRRGDGQAATRGRERFVDRNRSDVNFAIVDRLVEIAARIDATPAQVAIAWVMARAGVASPIVGARTVDQLLANLKAADLTVPADDLAALDALSQPSLNFPSEFLPLALHAANAGTTVNGQVFARSK